VAAIHSDFDRNLDRWRGTFELLLTGYALQLCEKQITIKGIEIEIKATSVEMVTEARNWIALSCDGVQAGIGRLAPRFLVGYPGRLALAQQHIPPALLEGRLAAKETERIVEEISSRLSESCKLATLKALDLSKKWIVERGLANISFAFCLERIEDDVEVHFLIACVYNISRTQFEVRKEYLFRRWIKLLESFNYCQE
jgi:hypothetical protein